MLVTGGVLHVDIIIGVPGLVHGPLQPRPHEGAGLAQLPRLLLPDRDVVLQQTCQRCLTMSTILGRRQSKLSGLY